MTTPEDPRGTTGGSSGGGGARGAVVGGAAALPVALALLGSATGTEAEAGPQRVMMTRAAVTARATTEELPESIQAFLAEHNPFGVPTTTVAGNRSRIVRRGYSLEHNNVDKIAEWVAYRLTRENATGDQERTEDFKPDPLLLRGHRAELADYVGFKNVYDRGHQYAAGDAVGRERAVMSESFLLSNMTPQSSSLNRGRWRTLEMKVQGWARDRREVWVVTGPAFLDDDGDGVVDYFVIGANRVAVPTHYYKIVLSRDGPEADLEALAFLIPNERMAHKHDHYLVSIDRIEAVTGWEFFADLDDAVEGPLEATTADELWD